MTERQAKDGTIYQQTPEGRWRPVIRKDKHGTAFKKVGERKWRNVSQQDSFFDKVVGGVVKAAEFVDRYTGAPARAGVDAFLEDEPVLPAISGQFGETTKGVPSGWDLAEKMGVPDVSSNPEGRPYTSHKTGITVEHDPDAFDPTLRDIVGLGLEVGADLSLGLAGAAKGVAAGARGLRGALKTKKTVDAAQTAKTSAEASAKTTAKVSGGGVDVEMGGEFFDVKTPESLEELRKWKPEGGEGELLQKARLKEIEETLPELKTKPLKYHYDMLENPKAMKEFKLKFENLPTKDAQKIAAYNQQMLKESTETLVKEIDTYAGSAPRSVTDAGNDLIDTIKTKYAEQKQALGPMFEEIQKRSHAMNQTVSGDTVALIAEEVGLSKYLRVDPQTGRYAMAKYRPRMGISRSEYREMAELFDDLSDGMTFKEIQAVRASLRAQIDPLKPDATRSLSKARQVLLRQLEGMAGKLGDDVSIVFKKYAINERSVTNVEKIFGGQIEGFETLYAANPDKVVDKVFSNPNYVKVLSEYVGPEKMREMVSVYLNEGLRRATDTASGISPEKFRNWLKTPRVNQFLENNVDAETIKRLRALADRGYLSKRFLDDVNPSGTAASLLEAIKPGKFSHRVRSEGITGIIQSEVASAVESLLTQKGATEFLDESLGGAKKMSTPAKSSKQALMSKMDIDRLAKGAAAQAGVRGAVSAAKESDGEKKTKRRQAMPRWASRGFNRMLDDKNANWLDDPLLVKKLWKDKKALDLFVRASDLKPNSRAMKNLLDELKKRSGEIE